MVCGGKKKTKCAFPYGRNVLLISAAASFTAINYTDFESSLIVGFNKGDVSSDTSLEFIKSFNVFLGVSFAQNNSIKIIAPLKHMEKKDIINYAYKFGKEGVDILRNSWSCYEMGQNFKNLHCGKCDACKKRKEGFKISGKLDPTSYYHADD